MSAHVTHFVRTVIGALAEVRALALGVMGVLVGVGAASRLSAQGAVPPQPRWEGRLDAALSPHAGALGGLGMSVRAGSYTRLGLSASAGVGRRAGAWEARQRLEATARFLFDPFGEHAHGLYGGAGLAASRDGTAGGRGELIVVIGLEGAPTGRTIPAVEVTLGGGLRLGLVLRGRRPSGR